MKKISLLFILAVLPVVISFAQSASPIEMKKVFGGYQFIQGEQRLNMKQLVAAMEPNTVAFEKISKAKSTYSATIILSAAGGALIGWPIGTSLGGGEPNWVLAGVGAGLIGVAIPLNIKFNRQAREAVDLYNAGLQDLSFWQRSEWQLRFQGNGLSLALKF